MGKGAEGKLKREGIYVYLYTLLLFSMTTTSKRNDQFDQVKD